MAEPVATNVFSRAQDRANGPGSGTVMSWVNTPMSSLLGISGSRERGGGGAMKETLRWSSVGLASPENGFRAQECIRSNCICPIRTESANGHFIVRNYKPKRSVLSTQKSNIRKKCHY